MARYTCSYHVGLPEKEMIASLKEIIDECDLNLTYETGGYIMAKEKPGNVAFPKLVEVEILYDRTKPDQDSIQVDFVAKNEELPLQTQNHCYHIFNGIQSIINTKKPWEPESENPQDD
ncbi:hypothetical protein Lepto7376_3303 [[Leptolyngbya] sp. PCC 7376]|uniref:hypothetical protein n=1 Tax=[Leptolyngbya] sp. PCC 7376 TaxID=111781 RepID=UPI00029ED6F4|nr:hypothetical protein [[Leptolyngbya] sp. PCC 7376]AFY39527.1 hypothetical protein Lepto7376_3303 [[Leptolyngbya] sp. PCC 7376]